MMKQLQDDGIMVQALRKNIKWHGRRKRYSCISSKLPPHGAERHCDINGNIAHLSERPELPFSKAMHTVSRHAPL